MTNNLTVYGGEIIIRALMILKALRRLKSVPAAALPASAIQEADGAS